MESIIAILVVAVATFIVVQSRKRESKNFSDAKERIREMSIRAELERDRLAYQINKDLEKRRDKIKEELNKQIKNQE